jgi:tricarballylate dehydrogenase
MSNTHHDLIVVGCGAAGLSAALSYAETAQAAGRHFNIAVLEVAPKEDRGGATGWTTAAFRVGSDGTLDPFWVGLVEETSRGLADSEYCRVFESEVPNTLATVRQYGVELMHRKAPIAMATPDGTHVPNGGGRAIVDALAARIDATAGIEILYETEAVRLRTAEDGSVEGIVVRGSDGRLRTLAAKAVVLACGGFEGNPEMLTRYVGQNACDLRLIAPGVAFNKGAGIRMAMEIGADAAGQFDGIHAEMVDPRTDRADAVIYPHPYGIMVNGDGQRFWDEGSGTFDATFELIAYEVWRNQKNTAFFIGDQTITDNIAIMKLFDTDQPAIVADSIEQLAVQLGLEPEVLADTVAAYNAAIQPGEFDPTQYDGKCTDGITPPKSNWAYPLANPPFFAYPVTTAITFTYGGLRTDISARVLATNGAPIPNLYAAGEIVGLFYHEYPGATSVLKALTFGRLAGAHAARAHAA